MIIINFSPIKHMFWVHKRNVSMRHFFYAPKTYVIIDSYKKKIINSSYSLNPVCTKFSNFQGFTVFGWLYHSLSYDVASGSEITPCIKIDKLLVVYMFTGNVMTSITKLHT